MPVKMGHAWRDSLFLYLRLCLIGSIVLSPHLLHRSPRFGLCFHLWMRIALTSWMALIVSPNYCFPSIHHPLGYLLDHWTRYPILWIVSLSCPRCCSFLACRSTTVCRQTFRRFLCCPFVHRILSRYLRTVRCSCPVGPFSRWIQSQSFRLEVSQTYRLEVSRLGFFAIGSLSSFQGSSFCQEYLVCSLEFPFCYLRLALRRLIFDSEHFLMPRYEFGLESNSIDWVQGHPSQLGNDCRLRSHEIRFCRQRLDCVHLAQKNRPQRLDPFCPISTQSS